MKDLFKGRFATLALALGLVSCTAMAGCGGDSTVEIVDDTGTTSETGDDTGTAGDSAGGDSSTDTGTGTDTGTDDGGTDGTVTDGGSDGGSDGTVTDGTTTDGTTTDGTTTDGTTTDGSTGPTLSIADVALSEGNSGTTNAVFTVTLSAASTSAVTVNYATADGTATTASGDYVAGSGTLTFPAGTTTQTISVPINGDTTYENNETFTVALSAPSGATLAKGSATGTINNDDAAPTLAINNVNAAEGNSGTKNFTFTVTLTGATEVPVTVAYATANDTATAGSDYTATSGTLTFAPSDIAKAINVPVIGDTTSEPNEAFLVQLSSATAATITDASGTGNIFNDDGTTTLPSLTIANATTTEGNTGTKTMTFTVTLSAAATGTVTVNYATSSAGGGGGGGITPATAGTDYVAASGTLTFAAGETSKTISVTINGDTLNEADETFFVNLSGASGAFIADGFATGTITNDDALPSFTISDVTKAEGTGGGGPTAFTFTVTLSAASGRNVGVNWATAAGTATAGSDYGNGNGFLVFAPGTTTRTITVNVNPDAVKESDETFFINLTGAFNATISDAQGVGTITNDD